MSEKYTYGFNIKVTETVAPVEPVSVSEVKNHLGITFTAHDSQIESLISACRKQAEKYFQKSLIDGHSVSVFWLNFYDDEPLPYAPLHNVPQLTVTDLNGVTINEADYKVRDLGGSSPLFIGKFPNGVKLEYLTKAVEDEDIKQRLIDAVGDCLHHEMTIYQSVKKNFSNAAI